MEACDREELPAAPRSVQIQSPCGFALGAFPDTQRIAAAPTLMQHSALFDAIEMIPFSSSF